MSEVEKLRPKPRTCNIRAAFHYFIEQYEEGYARGHLRDSVV